MKDIVSQSLKIITPPFIGICLVVFAIYKYYDMKSDGISAEVSFIIFSLKIPDNLQGYLAAFAVGLVLISFSLLRNYAEILPDKLAFLLFFDDKGIEKIVKQYQNISNIDLIYSEENKIQSQEHKQKMLMDIGKILDIDIDPQNYNKTYGKGLTTFVVKKSNRFLQNYSIIDVKGTLEMSIPVKDPSHSYFTYKTFSSLESTPFNEFEISFFDMVSKGYFFVTPLLCQSLNALGSKEISLFKTLAITRIRYLPFIFVDKTLYCVESEAGYVPIGYGVYEQ